MGSRFSFTSIVLTYGKQLYRLISPAEHGVISFRTRYVKSTKSTCHGSQFSDDRQCNI